MTLILDLDETLIHSNFIRDERADLIIPVNLKILIDLNGR